MSNRKAKRERQRIRHQLRNERRAEIGYESPSKPKVKAATPKPKRVPIYGIRTLMVQRDKASNKLRTSSPVGTDWTDGNDRDCYRYWTINGKQGTERKVYARVQSESVKARRNRKANDARHRRHLAKVKALGEGRTAATVAKGRKAKGHAPTIADRTDSIHEGAN